MRVSREPVRDIQLTRNITPSLIARELGHSGGFVGRTFAEAVDVLEQMFSDKSCTRFLSFPAAPVATGLRGVLAKLIRERRFDAIITTSGTLDHDLARSWSDYYRGDFTLDDTELRKKGFHRLGSVLIPEKSYGPMLEKRIQPFLTELYEEGIREISSSELSSRLGKLVRNKSSILYWASKNKVPVIIPGITDGAVGNQIWLFSQTHRDFKLDVLKDEELLSDIVFSAKASGALMIGGGISKHHTLWWNQFRQGLDYAVYLTTASEYDGSLSGAPVREAVSWGKVRPKAKMTTVHGDATVLLPFMVSAVLERLEQSF